MARKIAKIWLSSLLFIIGYGCKEELKKAEDSDLSRVERKPIIKFEEPIFDYGTVPQGTEVKHVFTLRNVGDEVLHIKSAQGG